MYQYGYTIIAGNETKENILGTFDEGELEKKKIEIDNANKAESRPNIKGVKTEPSSFYWIRQIRAITEKIQLDEEED